MWGNSVFLGNQPRLHHKRAGPQDPQFWGFPSIYAYTLCGWTTKFDVVTNVGREGRVPCGEGQYAFYLKRANALLGVLPLCLHHICTVLLSVYSGACLPIFIEIGSYLTDTEQKISWHVFFETWGRKLETVGWIENMWPRSAVHVICPFTSLSIMWPSHFDLWPLSQNGAVTRTTGNIFRSWSEIFLGLCVFLSCSWSYVTNSLPLWRSN